MSTANTELLVVNVIFSQKNLHVFLNDDRKLTVPLVYFPRLYWGKPEQRKQWSLIGKGEGVHWEELDEDISVTSFINLHRPIGG